MPQRKRWRLVVTTPDTWTHDDLIKYLEKTKEVYVDTCSDGVN
jgi:hypothetical protein